ncbi:NLI interacting factor-like phosphatase [Chiua virens]|nr:NLI interacting factor-like phosphatase [Chiua virens]
MNSLALLSRQLDAFVLPRTPPSTPTDAQSPFSFLHHRPSVKRRGSDTGGSLKRLNPWSDKTLDSDSPRPTGPGRPRRSYSSPSGFLPIPFPAPSVSDPAIRLQPTLRFRSTFRRLFFVRVFAIVWNTICATWASWTPGEVDGNRNPPDANNDDAPAVSPVIHQPPTSPSTPPASMDAPLRLVYEVHLKPEMGSLPTPPPSPVPGSPSPSLPISGRDSGTLPPAGAARETTPPLPSHRTPFHLPKTLVLDLDETLIHSTSKPISLSSGGFGLLGFGRRNKGHTVEVVLGGGSTLYHVYKRPFVDYFLRKVSAWYTLVVFTASMQEYADPVIDWLDAGRGILARRFFRESCTLLPNGSYTKDLSIIEQDLSRVCLVDNSPISYRINEGCEWYTNRGMDP